MSAMMSGGHALLDFRVPRKHNGDTRKSSPLNWLYYRIRLASPRNVPMRGRLLRFNRDR